MMTNSDIVLQNSNLYPNLGAGSQDRGAGSRNGFIKSEEKAKLQSVLNKTARYGFLPEWSPKTIDELLESSDITLFKAALKIPITSYTHSSHLLKHPVTT